MKRLTIAFVVLVATGPFGHAGGLTGRHVATDHRHQLRQSNGAGATISQPTGDHIEWNGPPSVPSWERGCTKFDEHGNWRDVC
jgi:hypothetical protein